MVIDQGSMLDRIDYNVENMTRDVKEADKELKVASGYQKKTIKRKIMLLLAILIAGVFILLSLKLSRKSNDPPALAAPDVSEDPPLAMLHMRRELPVLRTSPHRYRRKRRLWEEAARDPAVFDIP
jgi:syntaxin 16